MNESKKEIYDIIPQRYYPKTELVKERIQFNTVVTLLEKSAIQFPFIAKPDIGLRGSAVKKIETINDLQSYHEKANFDYLIQDLIPFENEIGVFYVRFPHESKGRITGIVAKEFLIVEGNGADTIEELLKKNPRFEFQLPSLQREYGDKLKEILPQGEQRNLVPFGNHARGAKFIDASSWNSPKLEEIINEMCLKIPGFYFGRLDIMYTTLEELEAGKNFALVELNGAASEPTHIYDPKHSLFFAWKELARHITYMYKISVINHKNGAPYLAHKTGMKEYRAHLSQSSKIVNF